MKATPKSGTGTYAQPCSPPRNTTRARIRSIPTQTKSRTTVTPRLTSIQVWRRSVSSASSCIAPRDSQTSTSSYPGRDGFRRMFQRGVPGPTCHRVRISSKLSNSRNCLIITTTLHIVNHCSTHLKKSEVSGLQSSKDSEFSIVGRLGTLQP